MPFSWSAFRMDGFAPLSFHLESIIYKFIIDGKWVADPTNDLHAKRCRGKPQFRIDCSIVIPFTHNNKNTSISPKP